MNAPIESPGYRHAMLRYADFSGRSTRSEFWLFMLVSILMGWLGLLIDHLAHTSFFYIGISLVHLIPSISVFVRRLHDTNRSGWLYLLILTILGVIPLLAFACLRGTPGPNAYGLEDPNYERARREYASAGAPYNAPAPASALDPIREIERLAELRNSGAITDAEFNTMKARILNRSTSARAEPTF